MGHITVETSALWHRAVSLRLVGELVAAVSRSLEEAEPAVMGSEPLTAAFADLCADWRAGLALAADQAYLTGDLLIEAIRGYEDVDGAVPAGCR